jgi:phosphatidylcholine synthase
MASTPRKIAAAAVHGLTASGAVWGLLAIEAIANGRIKTALCWMALALAIDSGDGLLARLADVRRVLPQVDGALLDNLVDYLNYAVVPALLIASTDLLPAGWSAIAGAGIVLAAVFQFAHVEAKSDDHFFRGFPSYWNILALYLLLLGWDPWVNLAVVALLAVLSFVPLYWVYPTRTPRLRVPTLVLAALWAAILLVQLARFPDQSRWPTYVSLLFVVYYAGSSLMLSFGRQKAKPR